jgi:hypothetical protein
MINQFRSPVGNQTLTLNSDLRYSAYIIPRHEAPQSDKSPVDLILLRSNRWGRFLTCRVYCHWRFLRILDVATSLGDLSTLNSRPRRLPTGAQLARRDTILPYSGSIVLPGPYRRNLNPLVPKLIRAAFTKTSFMFLVYPV